MCNKKQELMQTNFAQRKNILKWFIYRSISVPILLALVSLVFINTVAFGQLSCDNSFSVSPPARVYNASTNKRTYTFTINILPVATNASGHWGFQESLCANTGEYLSTRTNILSSINFFN